MSSHPGLGTGAAVRMARVPWFGLGLLVLAGLALRIWAGQGGLWLDEAWSVLLADQVGPGYGVFASIHHDNNHHLNSLWLQLVGAEAPSLVMRGLAIASSTATILVAGLIGARHGPRTALTTAALFALSPFMVLYGSEARGYAPMLLCLLGAVHVALRWTEGRDAAFPAGRMAALAGVGTLAHLMMVPGLLLIIAGSWITLRRNGGTRAASQAVAQAFGPALITCAGLLAVLFGTAYMVAGGMMVGSHTPFSWDLFRAAMGELATLVTGAGNYGGVGLWGWGLALLCALLPGRRGPPLFWLLLLALPLAVLLVQPGNAQFSRYYALSAAALLLIGGNRIGAMLSSGRVWQVAGFAILSAFSLASLAQVRDLGAVGRGAPQNVITALHARYPSGAHILLTHDRAQAVLRVAAGQVHYQLSTLAGCAPADALFVEQERGAAAPLLLAHCGQRWTRVAMRTVTGPSGQDWALYVPASVIR